MNQHSNSMPLMVTTEEFAASIRVCKETVLRMIRRGDLRAKRLGKGFRIPSSEVSRYVS